MKTIAWFSTGVSSAVAIKTAIDTIDEIIYIDIKDQHPDSKRFTAECEEWFGKPITIITNEKSVGEICTKQKYINGVAGAPCTSNLKFKVRKKWEKEQEDLNLTYIWGMDSTESKRADRLKSLMYEYNHVFPLIENEINKELAHKILRASGISRPKMYDLGYQNNNCIGCVKGGMGYWNKIRVDFPKVFEQRAKMEREIGASCINGVYLDELDPSRGRHESPVVEDCGIFCQLLEI